MNAELDFIRSLESVEVDRITNDDELLIAAESAKNSDNRIVFLAD